MHKAQRRTIAIPTQPCIINGCGTIRPSSSKQRNRKWLFLSLVDLPIMTSTSDQVIQGRELFQIQKADVMNFNGHGWKDDATCPARASASHAVAVIYP